MSIILLLAAVNFTHIVDFVIIMPLGDRLMRELDISPSQFSWIVSTYGIAACVASILASSIVDRFDRKTVLLTSYAGFCVSTLLCGLSPNYVMVVAEAIRSLDASNLLNGRAPNYELLLVARGLAGMFGGLAAGAIMAVIGDTFAPERRGRATGAIMSAFAVASIFGLPIGLILANEYGRGAPFITLAVAGAAVWFLVWFRLPSMRGHMAGGYPRPTREFLLVALNPNHVKAFACTLAMVLGTFTIIPFLAPYMTANAGRRESDLPYIYGVAGVCTLVSMNVIGWLADRIGKPPVFYAMASMSVVMTLVVTNLPPVPLYGAIVVASLFMVSASGRMVPAQATIIGCAKPHERGAFVSQNTAVQHFATGLAPLISGLIMGHGEDKSLTGYPIVGLVAACFGIASLALFSLLKPAPGPQSVSQTPSAAEGEQTKSAQTDGGSTKSGPTEGTQTVEAEPVAAA
ncbi:MFS transporter [Fimbriiglobus ruber]|uniref:Major facilitator family transporter n=1 Tax=Fimbriiglobus ruber TaxID=1908690 RepID=A0A225DYV3_9BACT|nr:MFS transporter [Fimbriiglobus ruber]OWK46531.1 Major facilitator family transporter [Fimbriiglobus ruber]